MLACAVLLDDVLMKLSMVAVSVQIALGCNDLNAHKELSMFIRESVKKRYYWSSN